MSNIVNKVKDALSSDKHHTSDTTGAHSHTAGTHGTHGTHNTTAGPHGSDAMNKLDPRVDSDRDGSNTVGGAGHAGGMGHSTHTTHTTGGGLTGGTHGHNTTAGPHSSDLMNKADPRVDSDRDGSRAMGGTTGGLGGTTHAGGLGGTTHSTGHHGTDTAFGHSGHGVGGGVGTTHHSTTAGPHSSDMLNKADPRVDSDRDGSRNMGAAGSGMTGTHGTHNTTGLGGAHTGAHTGTHGTHTGTHGTGLGGAHTGTGTHEGLTGGPGPAPNTAGPHKSDFMNKADPRVDSDLDGSKTMGGDKTFSSGTGNMLKDPHDAAQVPPSQFQQPHGHHSSAVQGSRQGSV